MQGRMTAVGAVQGSKATAGRSLHGGHDSVAPRIEQHSEEEASGQKWPHQPTELEIPVASWLFHQICVKKYVPPDKKSWDHFQVRLESSKRFFARFRGALQVGGKSVLDIGCGRGSTCVEAALRGAARVVGIDIQLPAIQWARDGPFQYYPRLAGRIEFLHTDGSLRELGAEQFDIVLSKDSFEHYADPEGFVSRMTGFLKREGVMAVGFGPLWKGPTGGHLDSMTKLPWAHLLFPERVIVNERRRFYPQEGARCFAEIRGGLNKMTLARFRAIMLASGLECIYFATNVSDNPIVRLMKLASYVPFAREYFTANLYSIWRRQQQI